jgi:ClpA/ClpB-like protein
VLENYSVEAQEVVSLATMEARRLGHGRIGTEHLLLGLLQDDDGEPAELLKAAGAHLVAARHKVVEAVGDDVGSPDGEALPFTDRAQRALERAGRFSRKDRESEVTAGHVLLGVLDVEGLACQVLRGLGVDLVHLRHAVVGGGPDSVVALADESTPIEPPMPSLEPPLQATTTRVPPNCPHCRAALDDSLAETTIAARRADGPSTNVSIVYCVACGATLGVMRPIRDLGC